MSEWIDVKERMPEEYASVLVWCPYWFGRPFIAHLRYGLWCGEQILSNEGEVTHWMPLPEPPPEAR